MFFKKLSLLSLITTSYLAEAALWRNHQHATSSSSSRRLNFDSCLVLKRLTEYKDAKMLAYNAEERCACETNDGTIAELDNIDAKTCAGMESAVSVLSSSTGFAFNEQTQTASIPIGAQLEIDSTGASSQRRRLATAGDKSVLIIRAKALDFETTNSETELLEEVLGVGGSDPVNLASQYSDCSYGQLTFHANTEYGNNGVHTTTIDTTVNLKDDGVIRNAMKDQSVIDFGVDDLKETSDYVLLCMPPRTSGGWIAYAYVNHYLSVYNDVWCTFPSGLMHEIGHNLGLAHSGLEGGSEYGDSSGMMGVSYASDDGPVMCFNGPKTYQLGWFPTYTQDVIDTTSFSWNGDLIGFVDKEEAQPNDKMIFRLIPKVNDEYYLHFNLQAGFNSGTNKAKNKVMISTRPRGLDYEKSLLVEVLEANEDYTIQNFGDLGALTIAVGSITLDSSGKSSAGITIQYGSGVSPTPSPISPPTPAPVVPPTSPISTPTSPPISPTTSPISTPTPPPNSPPTSCTECSNDETPFMDNSGLDCTATNLVNTKCNKSYQWINNNYCKLSCFEAGNGYDGDNCCVGPNPAPVVPPSPAPVVSPTPAPVAPPSPAPVVPPTPAPISCTECSNEATAAMERRGKDCELINLQNKCNKKWQWITNNFCQKSCFLEGLGYGGDNCCP